MLWRGDEPFLEALSVCLFFFLACFSFLDAVWERMRVGGGGKGVGRLGLRRPG